MNIDKLRQDLEIDEGIKHEVYLDHLNLKTVGIGHLCREDEPEYEMEVGTPISDERVQQLFERDLDMVRLDCVKLYPNCLLYTSPSPRDGLLSRMPSSA